LLPKPPRPVSKTSATKTPSKQKIEKVEPEKVVDQQQQLKPSLIVGQKRRSSDRVELLRPVQAQQTKPEESSQI